MVRRIPTQVHKQASRLLQANYLKREPIWFQAVLEHPPLPLPAKIPASRSPYDLSSRTKISAVDPRPLPVSYMEDEIRRQFFRDHPFEAFRPTSLLEGAGIESEHPVRGAEWTRLRQRGRNPKAEDAIRFALNLHEYHKMSLSDAYKTATAQFRALRSEHEIASSFAALEAEAHGAQFGPTATEAGFNKELKAVQSWDTDERYDPSAIAARKRWKMVAERDQPTTGWTGGAEYVKLWKEGVRPDYSPALTKPVAITEAGLEFGSTGAGPESADIFNLASFARK